MLEATAKVIQPNELKLILLWVPDHALKDGLKLKPYLALLEVDGLSCTCSFLAVGLIRVRSHGLHLRLYGPQT